MNEDREQMLARIIAGADLERVQLASDLIQQGWPLWRIREHLDWLDNAKSPPEKPPTRVTVPSIARPKEDSRLQPASFQSSGEISVLAASSQSSGEISVIDASSQSPGEISVIAVSSQSSGEITAMASSSQSSGEIAAMAGPKHANLPV